MNEHAFRVTHLLPVQQGNESEVFNGSVRLGDLLLQRGNTK